MTDCYLPDRLIIEKEAIMKIKVIGFTKSYNSKADRRFTNGQRHSVKPIIVDIRKRDTAAPSVFDGTAYECRQKIKELNLK